MKFQLSAASCLCWPDNCCRCCEADGRGFELLTGRGFVPCTDGQVQPAIVSVPKETFDDLVCGGIHARGFNLWHGAEFIERAADFFEAMDV